MSPRSFRRERERAAVAEGRRDQLRLRRGVVAGAAVGAFALVPAAAQAQNFTVNTLGDAAANGCAPGPGGCTLRDAITDASANADPDLITFESGLTGTLRLTQGQLATSTTIPNDITVQGPGAGTITISGDADSNGPDTGDSRIFYVSYLSDSGAPTNSSLTVSGLTLSGGYSTDGGGAVYVNEDNRLNLSGVTVTGSKSVDGTVSGDKYSQITISNSTISGNDAAAGGAVFTNGRLTIQGSTLSNNHATGGPYASGGAIDFGQKYGGMAITDSTITGNTAEGLGGGIASFSDTGSPKYNPTQNTIVNTTISGNSADGIGGGLYSEGLGSDQGSFTIDHSTFSGNHAGSGAQGGGVQIGNTVYGTFRTVDSTISGNSANIGAGVSIATENTKQVGPDGSISFDNSTIASNTATTSGGGMYVGIYGPTGGGPYTYSANIGLNSTIVANNSANGASSDLDHADVATTGGFALAFSLVQAPGDGVANQSNSLLNADPQLGGLASNGGPTQTQLPAASSPAIDAGSNSLALSTDQRGLPRTVDQSAPNAGDGTDIGAVELSAPASVAKKKCKKKKKKHKKKHREAAALTSTAAGSPAESAKKKHKKHSKCKKKHKKKKHKR